MQEHWERVYATKSSDQVSWYRPHLENSLRLIEDAARGDLSTSIVDVGGGASTLVDDLVERGYRNLTVVDISANALDIAKARLANALSVQWVQHDVTDRGLPQRAYDVWHDRAVFHFLTEAKQREAYVRNLYAALRPGGHVILATFGPNGPMKCSGLDVVRYSAEALRQELGPGFTLIQSFNERHLTPFGTTQEFLYCHFVVAP